MEKEKIKELLEKQDNKTIALTIMDLAHKDFNKDNFYYYDFSINIFMRVELLAHDGIIERDRAALINKEMAKLINQAIYDSKDKC